MPLIPRSITFVSTLALAAVPGCISSPPPERSVTTIERLDAVPAGYAPVNAPVTIHWDARQFPFIEAGDDRDVPFALGVVHAHLRRGQILMLRRIAQGRLAESVGPFPQAVDIDHALRAIDFPRAAEEIERTMRPDVLAWVRRYVEGLNHHAASSREDPVEQRVLAIDDEPWTVRDIITLGRLASIDITWGAFYSWMNLHAEKGFSDYWTRSLRFAGEATPSFGGEGPVRFLASLGKTGSNSFALAGSRTTSGLPILANDPHVGFNLPALWCYVGYHSPGLHAAGFTIPGLPFVLLGRNRDIAWGGTNMQGISSTLYDASTIPESDIREREIRINRRLWFPATRTIRETPLGPIISEVGPLEGEIDRPLVLRWRGHEPSREFEAFHDASRATNWAEFRAAFAPYAVSGQNMLFASRTGDIGHVLAYEFQPAAGLAARLPVANPDNPEHRWQQRVPSDRLPAAHNPASGFLVSTNNTPVRSDPAMVLAGNANDRHDRLSDLIVTASRPLTVDDAAQFQLDTYSASAHALARILAERAAPLAANHPLLSDLRTWDGRYAVDSRGALVLQLLAYHLAAEGYKDRYSPKIIDALRGSSATMSLLAEDARAGLFDAVIPKSLDLALVDMTQNDAPKVWGDLHTLRLSHWIGLAPIIGGPYRFGEFPVAGSTTTVLKSAHALTNEKHRVNYGANARHIVDLADPDGNYVVILAGQDGWLGSENFLDQTDAWREGRLFKVPMTLPAVRAAAVRQTTLTPAPPR
jgi:penicillin amidase